MAENIVKNIWISKCFKKIGKSFREMPEISITSELIKSLEKAREGEIMDNYDEEEHEARDPRY